MKKIISLALCLCLLLGLCPVSVFAEDVVQQKFIKISSGDGIKAYPCLWNTEEVFCSPDVLAEITGFVAYPSEDSYNVDFCRYYEGMEDTSFNEEFLKVSVIANKEESSADIEVMNQSYTVDCYIQDATLYLPLDKLLYLLHAEWGIMDDSLYISPLPYTLLDFWAIHRNDLAKIESVQEDTLIETGWFKDDSLFWQSVYSSLSGVFSDFDGKIFLGTWTEEGGLDNVVTQEYYKNAILQLAKDDIEYVSEDIQEEAIESFVNSTFAINSGPISQMKDTLSIGSNISEIIDSTDDAVEILEQIQEKFPTFKVSEKLKNIANKIDAGEIDSSFLQIPELDNKVKELSAAGDAMSLLQCVWDAYDFADTVSDLDENYLEQIKILQDYEYTDSLNKGIIDYVKSSARILIESHENPTSAGIETGIQNALALFLSTVFQESPQGKAFSVISAVGNCCGVINVDFQDTYDTYAELALVTFSIKVEQLVQELLHYNPLVYSEDELTAEEIKEVRNQLVLYLKFNLRNKSYLYDLNVKGNSNQNWSSTDEAKALHDEILLSYSMLVELINTKDYDSSLILYENIEELDSSYPVITESLLLDEQYIEIDRIEFNATVNGNQALVTAYDQSGNVVWEYSTPEYEPAELPRVSEVGQNADMYYLVQDGSVIALNVQTGAVEWQNTDFQGSGTSVAFGEDAIYLSGYYGPDFFAVSFDGETLTRIERFDENYYWAYDIELNENRAAVYLEGGSNGGQTPQIFYVDLDTFTYSHETQSDETEGDYVGIYRYANGEFLSELQIYETNGSKQAQLMFWHNYGASASDEDFFFEWKDNTWEYEVTGNRSQKIFLLSFSPTETGMTVRVTCNEGPYFDWQTGAAVEEWINAEYTLQ